MLIPKDQFMGIDDVVHLATGGESPMLRTHQQAVERFCYDKAQGEQARDLLEATYSRCKLKIAQHFNVNADDICFLASASDGMNLLAHGLSWQAGDNIVVADVEFPSNVLPWTTLAKQGVEVRIVPHHDWQIQLDDIAALMDARTRLLVVSQVSYFTGQRMDLAALSTLVRSTPRSRLVVDATHAAGVIPVDARHADILVSSCYKWLLGVHGAAVFYWNKERLPELSPPFLGWNSGTHLPSWDEPLSYQLPGNADRFLPGNPSFISLYILENALNSLQQFDQSTIEAHSLALSQQVYEGLHEAGWKLMTPHKAAERAGNVCFEAENVDRIVQSLREQGVLIWGGYGGVNRIRVSTHVYNSATDVQLFLQALKQ